MRFIRLWCVRRVWLGEVGCAERKNIVESGRHGHHMARAGFLSRSEGEVDLSTSSGAAHRLLGYVDPPDNPNHPLMHS